MTSKLLSQKQIILERIANGDFLKDIGKDLGVTGQQIGYLAKNHFPDEYLQAKEAGIENRLDNATQKLNSIVDSAEDEGNNRSISDSYSLARIYELSLKRCEWRASVELPNKYGNNGNNKVEISIGNDTSAELQEDAKSLVAKIRKV